jgi:CHAT domain/Ternary complex associated domain 7
MPTVTRTSGMTVDAPDTYRVADIGAPAAGASRRGPGRGRVSGPVPMPAAPDSADGADSDALLAALAKQDLEIIDRVELQPQLEPIARDGQRRSTAPRVAERQDATIELTVGADEDAVLLLEQDGVFKWNLPASSALVPGEGRRRGPGGTRKTVRFTVEIRATREAPGQARRGLVSDTIYDRVKIYALKFAAHVAIGLGMRFLERNVRRGLVQMRGLDPAAWSPVKPSEVALPADRPARILLFVHGTFSSTIGSFGALCSTPWGQAFLSAAAAQYDAILGLDHATLSDDPVANATELLSALESLPTAMPPVIDAVAFGRGGLVFRSLVEHLLPHSTLQCRIQRAVFVACANGGTPLARPENWHTLVDLYTNIAVAVFRLLALLPQAASVARILEELVSGVGAFVKFLATYATEDVPGLGAMRPDGDFIRTLNTRQPGQPDPGVIAYYAVTSEFRPAIRGGTHEPRELPLRLVMALADGLVDKVMGEANDLVVNTASMTAIDEAVGVYVRDTFAFGATPHVYHTTYFIRPEVVSALTRWLALPAPVPATRDAGQAGAQAAAHELMPPLPGPREAFVPASVDTNIVIADAAAPAREASALIEQTSPSYIVVRRRHQGESLHYAFRPEEILASASNQPDRLLLDVLGLHEWQRSPERSVNAVTSVPDTGGPPSTHRSVVLIDDTPIGVVPEAGASLDVVALVRAATSLGSVAERVATRRAMPTFTRDTHPAPGLAFSGPGVRGGWRSATRSGEAASPPAAAPQADEPRVECHMLAEMDPEVKLGHTATIEVVLSRDMLDLPQGAAAAIGRAEVAARVPLLVQVVPRANFVLADPAHDREEVRPPEAGEPLTLYFDVKAAHAGPGEVWILVRQNQMEVATLVLEPSVVDRAPSRARRVVAQADAVAAPKLAQLLDQLSIIEQRVGDTVQYLFEVEMPSINELGLYTSAPLQQKRDEFVKTLYKEIEDRYVSAYDRATNKADAAAFTAELQAYGAVLFDKLLPREMQELLWRHRDAIKSIRVVSTEPFIPWEIIHLREPGKALDPNAPPRFLGQMGLVRWLHNVGGLPPTTLRVRRGYARYVIPDYPHRDWQLPETANERRYLEEHFSAVPIEPQPNPLRTALTQPGSFDLLHFACHGEAESDAISHARIVLQGRVEGTSFVPTHLNASTVETFARLRSDDGGQPIVFLNACQAGRAGYQLTGIGGFAQAFLRGGAGAFIGALWSVGDQPAFVFGKAFYDALLRGAMVSQAAIAAREAARQDDATWLAYVVYGHPHARLKQE